MPLYGSDPSSSDFVLFYFIFCGYRRMHRRISPTIEHSSMLNNKLKVCLLKNTMYVFTGFSVLCHFLFLILCLFVILAVF